MALIGRGGEGAATEVCILKHMSLHDLLRAHIARLGIQALELELSAALLKPEAGKLAHLSAALELLVLVPIAHASPHPPA